VSTIDIPLGRVLTPELEGLPDLGSSEEAEGCVARAAAAPICHDLRDVFNSLGQEFPQHLRLYDRFRLWLVPSRLAIIRKSGFSEPVSVGLEVDYDSDGQTCSVVALLPSPEFVIHGSVNLDSRIAGSLDASGQLSPLPASDELRPEAAVKGTMMAGLEMKASAGLGLKFEATVVTPFVSAVGVGSSRAEWRFDKHREALFGRDIETCSIVALPKRRKAFAYRVKYSITTRIAFFPTRRESDWTRIECEMSS
jgi:hypothetical protein